MQVYVRIMGKNKLHRVKLEYPNMMYVEFVLDDGQEFTVNDDGDKLRISTTNGRLIIEPEVSNVIQVRELKE